MLVSVKGTFKDGVVRLDEPVEGREGQKVIVTFVEENQATPRPRQEPTPEEIAAGWEHFPQLLDECVVDTGIPDLAHQHDHYLHGTPKREDYTPKQED